jgi:hypothetical protein
MSIGERRPRGGGSFFGRRKGRPLHAGQQAADETLAPELALDSAQPAHLLLGMTWPRADIREAEHRQ